MAWGVGGGGGEQEFIAAVVVISCGGGGHDDDFVTHRILDQYDVTGEQKKKKKRFTSFSQPTRLITCANHAALAATWRLTHHLNA